MHDPVQYRIAMPNRRQHLFEVTVVVPADAASGARLVLPAWSPGSYVIRNYSRFVQQVTAVDGDGSAVEVVMDGITSWLLPTGVVGPVEVTFEIYANELGVRANHVDDHHALLVGAAAHPYVDGLRDRPVEVEVLADEPVHHLLPSAGDAGTDARRFRADDYDHLVDSAMDVGDFPIAEWETAGVAHRLIWSGHGGQPDLDTLAEDAQKITAAAVELFGGDLPVTGQYTFLTVGGSSGGGGLEHRDGAVLMMPTTTFQRPDTYAQFQALVAHEYLHLWNVKRMRPADLVEFDYEAPNHSPSLWVAEGWTAYFDELLPVRAGLHTPTHYFKGLAQQTTTVLRAPGLSIQNVRKASHEAWTKQYVRDENTPNATVDYYPHGATLAWALDLTIRRANPQGHGLDDAIRALWSAFGRADAGYTEDDVVEVASKAAGQPLDDFFALHVGGTTPVPIDALVEVVGLTFEDVPGRTVPHLGINGRAENGFMVAAQVLRGGPAWDAGMTGGDQLIAIDGERIVADRLDDHLARFSEGAEVEVHVLRDSRLLALPVRLGAPRPDRRLRAVDDPDEAQMEAYRRWTATELTELPAPPAPSN